MLKKKVLLLTLLVFMLVAVFGFGASAVASQVTTVTFEHGDHERSYNYYVPSSYDGKQRVPLVFSFHGLGSEPAGQQLLTQMVYLAEDEGFIAVFPSSTALEGTHDVLPALPNANRQWNIGLPMSLQYFAEVDDVGFVEEIIEQLSSEYRVDRNRVFATGMSNGAMFSYYLAAKIPDKIAGIAAVTAGTPLNIAEMKDELKPVTVIIMMGTDDPIVPYEGTEGAFMSAEATAAFWVEVNGITAEPEVEYLDPVKDDDPSRIKRTMWTGGIDGTAVILYTIEGGGHTWPGGHQYYPVEAIGLASQQMDGSAVLWENFVEFGPEATADLNWIYYAGGGVLLLVIIVVVLLAVRKKKPAAEA